MLSKEELSKKVKKLEQLKVKVLQVENKAKELLSYIDELKEAEEAIFNM